MKIIKKHVVPSKPTPKTEKITEKAPEKLKEKTPDCAECAKAQIKIQALREFLIDMRDNVVSGNPNRVDAINRVI